MRSSLVLGLVILAAAAYVAPAHASTSSEYLAVRDAKRISSVSIRDARSRTGHAGLLVEWAGTVQGAATSSEGTYTLLGLAGGESILLSTSSHLQAGSRVYVIGRIVEKCGLIHHLEVVAIADCDAVRAAYVARERRAAEPRVALSSGVVLDARSPARRATYRPLSVACATRWIQSFNPDLGSAAATDMARVVLRESAANGVDPRLVLSLFAAESRFHADAVSCTGALGIGQLMPDTANDLGVRDPRDAEQNIVGAVRHIASLLDRWKGESRQVEFTLASYNAGAGAVEKYAGIPPYAETIGYVRTIMGYYDELGRQH